MPNLYTRGGNPKGAKTGRTAPFQQCRGRFSRTYSPASQCPCRHQRWTPLAPPERHSSLTDLSGTSSIPINLRMSRGEGSTQRRSEASGCSGREVPLLGEAHQQGPSLPSADTYNLIIPSTLAAISKPSWHHCLGFTYTLARGCSPIEINALPSSWSVVTGEAHRLTAMGVNRSR